MDVSTETERLILRRFTPYDVDLLVELDSDPQVRIPGDEHGDVEYAATRQEWERHGGGTQWR